MFLPLDAKTHNLDLLRDYILFYNSLFQLFLISYYRIISTRFSNGIGNPLRKWYDPFKTYHFRAESRPLLHVLVCLCCQQPRRVMAGLFTYLSRRSSLSSVYSINKHNSLTLFNGNGIHKYPQLVRRFGFGCFLS